MSVFVVGQACIFVRVYVCVHFIYSLTVDRSISPQFISKAIVYAV